MIVNSGHFHPTTEKHKIDPDHSLYIIENQFSGTLNYAHHQTETNTCNETTENSENQLSNIIVNFEFVVHH